jgi:hypothetical protein
MSKLATLIMRPRYYHGKQIKIDYEVQFSIDLIFNDNTRKKSIKKNTKNNSSQLELTY